jgi:carbonic anhydrase
MLLAPACSCADPAGSAHSQDAVEQKEQAPHWSYARPDAWGDLSPDWVTCKAGARQSPIDLGAERADEALSPIRLSYPRTPLRLVNNGHTIQAEAAAGSQMIAEGSVYDLVQLHFHAPSEHTVDGHHSAMEMHLVHKDALGRRAVLGILLEEGPPSALLEPIFANAPEEGERAEPSGELLELGSLAARARGGFVTYGGSLTTPPCDEGITWYVLQRPLTVSAEQLAAYERRMRDATSRPTQPRNGRAVRRFAP